jgi:hypothetical protein
MALILHCGAEHVDPAVLSQLPVPPPMGARHVIRPFSEDVEIIKDRLSNIGGFIQEEAYGVKMGAVYPKQFFGIIGVKFSGVHTDDSYQVIVGVRGSYDQSLPRGLAMGSRVLVCDNLAFSGEVNVTTKQTTNIDKRLPGLLARAIEQLPLLAEHQQLKFDAYRNFQLDPVEADAMMVELVRRGAVAPSQIGKIVQEWDHPSHKEHADQGNSLWRFHNAVTEASKPTSPDRAGVPQAWGRTQIMTKFFDEMVS